jgi:hypothetical protein
MRTDTVTFCGEFDIVTHFGERSNSESLAYSGRHTLVRRFGFKPLQASHVPDKPQLTI